MKLSISNIAWPKEADNAVYDLLIIHGVNAIEIAPTRIWPDWQYSPAQVDAVNADLAIRGLQCSSLQAIVYGRPQLKVFGTPKEKQDLVLHLKQVANLAAQLGVGPLVFGAPKNRDRGDRSEANAFAEAVDLFAEVGDYCNQVGVCLCIEPNPIDYGCTFITDSQSGAAFVRTVNSPGLRLHLDVAGMHLAGESIPQALESTADVLYHIHISEPYLGSFTSPQIDHREVAQGLATIGWSRWISVEMRATHQPIADVEQAIQYVQETYQTI
ncbi:MAG: sugar phosphate isomerase/epimerase family protein [Spirulina sp.]